jgi:hypothetical protein
LRVLQPFDCKILLYDPFLTPQAARGLGAELVGLDAIFERSDIVSVHAPALPDTRHLIGAAQLRKLRDGAAFINTARGDVLDHDALLQECRTGRIVAALDVTSPEPLPPESELWTLPNVILTPHIGHATSHRRKVLEVRLRESGAKPRQRGFAGPCRAKEETRRHPVGLDRAPQRGIGANQVALPRELIKRARPHPRRQWLQLQRWGCRRPSRCRRASPAARRGLGGGRVVRKQAHTRQFTKKRAHSPFIKWGC